MAKPDEAPTKRKQGLRDLRDLLQLQEFAFFVHRKSGVGTSGEGMAGCVRLHEAPQMMAKLEHKGGCGHKRTRE